jgi:hypothetical protein
MSKQIRFLGAVALLLAGATQADTVAPPAQQPSTVRNEVSMPTSLGIGAKGAVDTPRIHEKLQPEALPPYVNGGHFGDASSDDN